MKCKPFPLFDTYGEFLELNFQQLSKERQVVRDYLLAFPPELQAVESYLAVRGFLKSHADSAATFDSYRTQVEKMLLWALLIACKPLLEMRRHDAENFIEFCFEPPRDWISPVIQRRFIRVDETYIVNPNWRPFTISVPKSDRALHNCSDRESRPYRISKASVAQLFAVCSSFFQNSIDEGLSDANPFRTIKQKLVYKQPTSVDVVGRSFTPLQWNYVLETAEQMAAEKPEIHERTLFILATLFAMYLRVSDLAGHEKWKPTMGDFRRDASGNWWLYVLGSGNNETKISVRDEYVEVYLTRYRRYIGLPSLPSPYETHPMLTTLSGRAGLTSRRISQLLQAVFDRSAERMIKEGWDNYDVDHLRSASLYWLRHTSATIDAPHREMKDLQADLRHSWLSTTQSTYYNTLDEQRVHSIKTLPIKK